MKMLLAAALSAAVTAAQGSPTRPSSPPPATDGVERPDTAAPAANQSATDPSAFDPHAIVDAAWALEFAMILQGGSSPGATAAQAGLDRLAAADYPGAIAAFRSALDEPAQSGLEASNAFLLGWAYHGAGEEDQAIAMWRRAAAADARMVPVHIALADAYLKRSQRAMALEAVRAGLAAVPGSPELLDKLAQVTALR
jgi:tetratricopeptide (TPR) repeat protein